ncbi:nucleoside hydrolase-like domain-containing protein [Algoriphagus sp. CAU 1675]|uniref:nucleoside hydrolase-like domain-containing protein n=1 Tax=Algoriphagus sp. CAU 1675 TaxID=3032597 RepID=UPI0023DBC4B7|nr:nucleoside hydrolase-like domain-containing protein [Algoriphagus sp. CAU 1675]MDF2157234.1 DUF1593 domain-containing protein [Algoriphagus sp. CAU 1675]
MSNLFQAKRLWSFIRLLTFSSLIFFIHQVSSQTTSPSAKPRIIITADPELDDNNSLIRLILYSSDMQIEGLIYASSQFHWKGDGKGTKWFVPGREYDRFGMNECPCTSWRWAEGERFIHDIVVAYEKSYPNLKTHNPGYPSPEYLKSVIRYGNIDFDGDFSKDTPGSDLIRRKILDDHPGKLFITAWGGASTIARALYTIQRDFELTEDWKKIQAKINRKVVLLPSGDQDDTFASYIRPNWPDIEYRQFRQVPSYGYGAQIRASAENAPYLTSTWMKTNISDQGPLGELYRVWGDGKQMVEGDKVDYFGIAGKTNEELKAMGYLVWLPVQEKGSWLGEGDNHTVMNMLGNGLRAYEKGTYGGWGGRTILTAQPTAVSGMSSSGSADDMAALLSNQNRAQTDLEPFPNYFPEAQKDFAARMKWAVTPNFKDANHAPSLRIEGPLILMGSPGQKTKVHASVSDPDGDEVSIRWFQTPVSGFEAKAEISRPEGKSIELILPKDTKPGQEIHLIVAATDSGSPALTSYQRVIIRVKGL